MKLKQLREKNIKALKTEMLDLLREHFNLRMKITNGKVQQTHLIKRVRRDIARIKTLLAEKVNYND